MSASADPSFKPGNTEILHHPRISAAIIQTFSTVDRSAQLPSERAQAFMLSENAARFRAAFSLLRRQELVALGVNPHAVEGFVHEEY
jgi:hypothetical protein